MHLPLTATQHWHSVILGQLADAIVPIAPQRDPKIKNDRLIELTEKGYVTRELVTGETTPGYVYTITDRGRDLHKAYQGLKLCDSEKWLNDVSLAVMYLEFGDTLAAVPAVLETLRIFKEQELPYSRLYNSPQYKLIEALKLTDNVYLRTIALSWYTVDMTLDWADTDADLLKYDPDEVKSPVHSFSLSPFVAPALQVVIDWVETNQLRVRNISKVSKSAAIEAALMLAASYIMQLQQEAERLNHD